MRGLFRDSLQVYLRRNLVWTPFWVTSEMIRKSVVEKPVVSCLYLCYIVIIILVIINIIISIIMIRSLSTIY